MPTRASLNYSNTYHFPDLLECDHQRQTKIRSLSFRFIVTTRFKPLPQTIDFKERWARGIIARHQRKTCVIHQLDAKQLRHDLHYVLLRHLPYKIHDWQIAMLFHTIAIPLHFIVKQYPIRRNDRRNKRKQYAYLGFRTIDPIMHIISRQKSLTEFDTHPVLARFAKVKAHGI